MLSGTGIGIGQGVFQVLHEVTLQLPLAGEVAMVPRPLKYVHGHARGVGHLQKEDLVAGNVGDRRRIAFQRQGMKAVEQHAKAWVIGLAHDVPDLVTKRCVCLLGASFEIDSAPGRGTTFRIVFRPDGTGKAFFSLTTVEGNVVLASGTVNLPSETSVPDNKEVEVVIDVNVDAETGALADLVASGALAQGTPFDLELPLVTVANTIFRKT